MNATGPYWWLVNIVSGNGLVPSGNKPLPEPMLTQFLGRLMASLGHNELKKVNAIKIAHKISIILFGFQCPYSIPLNLYQSLHVNFSEIPN